MGIFNLFKKSKKDKKPDTEEKFNKEVSMKDKMFILSRENDFNKISEVLCRKFNINNSGESNVFEIHNNDINVSAVIFTKSMGEEEEKLVKDQAERVYGHFYEVDTQYTDIKTNLLYSLSLSQAIIFVNYSFIEDEEFDKKTFIEQTFASILDEINGVMLLMDDEEDGIYCKGEREDIAMELILSDKGKSTLENYLPNEGFKLTSENNEISYEQVKRRLRSREVIKGKYIYVPAWYPVIESETEAECRTPEEIAQRAVALMIISLYSEYRLGENMDYEEAYNFVKDIIDEYNADKFFSPEEREYINNPDSTEREQISYSWKYENLLVMEWALGLIDELDFPDHICDVPLTVRVLKDCHSIEEILNKAEPKSHKELLDECDLIFCLDWACVDTRVHRLPAPAGLDGGVTIERHKSLNWLVGSYERADWDDVGTNT